MPETEHRLPKNVTPKHYALVLDIPDLTIKKTVDGDGAEQLVQNPYSGRVTITLDVHEPTDTIVMNAKRLTVTSATIRGIAATSITVDDEKDRLSLHFARQYVAGEQIDLVLDFESVLETPTKARGLHSSTYTYDGAECMMVATQFEPTAARRAFPCFDEPALKATFDVTISAPSGKTILSNTDAKSYTCDDDAGVKTVIFETTPKMSTYLLAFIVGDLASIEAKAKSGTIVRVWAIPDRIHQAKFSLDLAVRTLDYLEDYFGIPYMLSKLDQVAIPDFASGAMENWGLVMYREFGLLVPEDAAIAIRKWATGVVPHEDTHQWFGNYVTMDWWSQLWLNESFASFVGDLCVDALFPELNWWDDFVAQDVARGKSLDSLRSSHPIEVEVADANQIDEIFDAISYSKGASILRMLHEYVGAEVFRAGVQRYLRKHAYGNAVTEDLLVAIEEESDKPVVDLFTTWIKQIGYPVVTVERDGMTLTLSQERFLLDRDPAVPESDDSLWPTPLLITEDGVEQWVLLTDATTTVELQSEDSSVLVNVGQSAFVRVLYTGELFDAVLTALADDSLSVKDRIGIHNDAYALLRAGYLSVDQYLSLIDASRNETNYLVWGEMIGGVVALLDLFADDPQIDVFSAWCRDLFAPKAAELGWLPIEGEHEGLTQLRPMVQSAAAKVGHKATIEQGTALFESASASIEDFVEGIPADLRSTVIAIAVRESGRPAFERVMALQQEAQAAAGQIPPDIELRLVQLLGVAHDEELLREGLEYALSDKVRGNDAGYAFGSISVQMKPVAWRLFTEELWPTLFERYGDDRSISSFIAGVATGIASHEHADAVEAFFEENPTPPAARMIKQIVEGIRTRADFRARNEQAFTDFLNSL